VWDCTALLIFLSFRLDREPAREQSFCSHRW
jgi:hypothetical protein